MQWPIFSGIFSDGHWRTSYPVNMVPVPKATGLSAGYLKVADGLREVGSHGGRSRGGILWRERLYRVQGQDLVRIASDGQVTVIGGVGNGPDVSFTYGFDHLAVASGGRLYLYDGTTLRQVTDADLLDVLDVVWVDGYFLTTDGEFLVVTELNDPFAVSPLKYGSSEVDPDPVVAVRKFRNEVYAVNRYTIELFTNVGGTGFPFQRINGAQIEKGAVGTHAVAVMDGGVAVLGGGRGEPVSVWLCQNGGAVKMATAEIDEILEGYTTEQIAGAYVETVQRRAHEVLMIHLPDRCLCYDVNASTALQTQVWYEYRSGSRANLAYRGKHHVWAYNTLTVADPLTGVFGVVDDQIATHWGAVARWEFATQMLYNETRGVLLHELELVGLYGETPLGASPEISTEYTVDGRTWSNPKTVTVGRQGQRNWRARWLGQGHLETFRAQRFRGDSAAKISATVVDARAEPLAW